MRILELAEDYFAPETGASIYQEVARFLQYRRMAESIGRFIVNFDLLRRKADPEMAMAQDFPENLFPFCACRTRRFPAKGSRRRWPAPRKA